MTENTCHTDESENQIGPADFSGNDLVARIETLVRTLHGRQTDIDDELRALTESALTSLPQAQHAGITVATPAGEVSSAAATGQLPVVLDEVQNEHGEGPCLSAAWEHHVVRIDDIVTESRWPVYCREARERTAVRSILSFRLFSDAKTTGALNFYSEQPGAFDDDSVELGLVLATHTALAWNLLRRENQFRSALLSRDLIGQAKGLVMERFGIDAVQAFDLLKTLSQESNTPLVDIAAQVVEAHVRTVRPDRSAE